MCTYRSVCAQIRLRSEGGVIDRNSAGRAILC